MQFFFFLFVLFKKLGFWLSFYIVELKYQSVLIPFIVFGFDWILCIGVYIALTIPYGRIAITYLKGYGSLTMQLQESS